MKGFNRLVFITILFGIAYYLAGGKEPARQVQLPVPPQPISTPTPSPVQIPVLEGLMPAWPPPQQDETNILIADRLTRSNYVLILDGSGSMGKQRCSGNRSKMAVARDAVNQWALSVPEDANLGLVVFDKGGFSIRLPLGLNNRDSFTLEVEKVEPYNKTPLTMALDTAYGMLLDQGRRQLGYGEYTVVIVTDGAADDIQALTASVNTILATSPVMLHTIGFCIGEDHSLNQPGRTYYRAADNPEQLRQGLQEVLAEAETFDLSGFSE